MRKLALFMVTLLVVLAGPATILAYGGPGLYELRLFDAASGDKGLVKVYNSPTALHVKIVSDGDWLIAEVQIYAGQDPVPIRKGKPLTSKFPFKTEYAHPSQQHDEVIQLDQVDFSWGVQGERIQNLAVHVDLVKLDPETGEVVASDAGWALGPNTIGEVDNAWWFTYELAHPKRGQFIDSPVKGLSYSGPTQQGVTGYDVDGMEGGFLFFPNERLTFSIGSLPLGSAVADRKITPLDLFPNSSTEDAEVINMARLLQSLDADAEPKGGIDIPPKVADCISNVVAENGYETIDFSNSVQIDEVIQKTIQQCNGAGGATLTVVSAEDAQAHLEETLNNVMFRKNASRTPHQGSAKAKLEVMPIWIPAQRSNGDPVNIQYTDEGGNPIPDGQAGDPVYAKPIIASYTDADPTTGAHDVWLAISRDDGSSWKRKNLSRMADHSSFTLPDGTSVYGHSKKPAIKVKGNYILVMWTSKFARGGKPGYAIDTADAYSFDDPYWTDDIWGVSGPQRSVDYAEEGFPEVGIVPYSAVWACRIVVDKTTGDITYFKPERLTSGRRDAYQLFLAGAGGAGFAAVWQEDPEGLRPGDASGPGPGWGGATTSHKTDIWYSSISWANFTKIDTNFEIGGDPQHDFGDDFEGRPKALVPMSLPMRITDNDALNTDNLMVELDPDSGLPVEDANGNWIPIINTDATSYDEQDPNEDGSGSHRYGYMVDGMCEDFYQFINNEGTTKRACVTADGRLLDGDTGASRPNIFLQPYYKQNPETGLYEKSAYAIIVYEETKGVGSGPTGHLPDEGPYGDEASPDEGKNVHYHSFDFKQPGRVSGGDILNLPETDGLGNPVYLVDEAGVPLLDFQGNKILAYENARRPRLIMQSKSGMGESKTVLVSLYKEGAEGKGRPSDIMMRRMVVANPGNPYDFQNFVCEQTAISDCGKEICVKGAKNMSSVTPTETWINPEAEPDSNGDSTKIVRWEHRERNLGDKSSSNPYDDARAHRGALRGDFLVMGYTWTPNWAASRNGHDKYDFFIRRSFDGGQSWTTDPDGSGVVHNDTFKVYTEGETEDDDEKRASYVVTTLYGPGEFEGALNLSQLKNNKETVAEPRIVATPGTIWKKGPGMTPDGTPYPGIPTGHPEDVQDKNVFWIAYGTAENPPKSAEGEILEGVHEQTGAPLDLYYTFSQNRGESFHLDTWEVNPDSDGNYAGEVVTRMPRLANGDPEQGECQLRMTPDGSRFYATWLQEGLEGSDIWVRRLMPNRFQRNVGTAAGQ